MIIRNKCNLCLNEAGNTIGRTYHIQYEKCPDIHWRKFFALTGTKEIFVELLVCGVCGQIFQKQLIDYDELAELESVTGDLIKNNQIQVGNYPKINEVLYIKRFERIHDFILNNVEKPEGKRILDVGGRTGSFGEPLLKYGVDLTIIDVEDYTGQNVAGSKFIYGNFDTYPFPHKFDIIIMNHVLEHIDFPITALERCHELLDENGIVFIDVPILPIGPGTYHHSECYIKPLISDAIRRAGFCLIDTDDLMAAYENSIINCYRVIARKDSKKTDVPVRNYRDYSLNILTDFYYDIINHFIDTREPFVIYGVNEVSQRLLKPIALDKANLLGFIDDDPRFWGQKFFGKEIFSKEFIDDNTDVRNIVILTLNRAETSMQLKELGQKGVQLISNNAYSYTLDCNTMFEELQPLADLRDKYLCYENLLYNSATMGHDHCRAGQKIKDIPAGAEVSQVSLYMDKEGEPKGTGSCVVRKVSDNSLVGTLGTVDISDLPDTTAPHPQWVLFDKSVRISQGGDYRVVFEWDTAGGDSSNYPRVRYNDTDTIAGEFTYCNAAGVWTDAPHWDTSIKMIISK